MLLQKSLNGRFGFTLAEVLVTLAIIGVVAAMTLPTLSQNYQKKVYITQLKKVYNLMSQAVLRLQTDKNALNPAEAGLISQESIDNFVPNYFKLVMTCDDVAEPCFSNQYISYGTHAVLNVPKGYKSYVLADGSAVAFKYSWSVSFPYTLIRVFVDLNGKSGPNVYGRDFFGMYIYSNGIIDIKSNTSHDAPLTEDERKSVTGYCGNGASLDACFGKILNDNWEMNY